MRNISIKGVFVMRESLVTPRAFAFPWFVPTILHEEWDDSKATMSMGDFIKTTPLGSGKKKSNENDPILKRKIMPIKTLDSIIRDAASNRGMKVHRVDHFDVIVYHSNYWKIEENSGTGSKKELFVVAGDHADWKLIPLHSDSRMVVSAVWRYAMIDHDQKEDEILPNGVSVIHNPKDDHINIGRFAGRDDTLYKKYIAPIVPKAKFSEIMNYLGLPIDMNKHWHDEHNKESKN